MLTGRRDRGNPGDDRVLAVSRVKFLGADPVRPGDVRTPILASWQRSRDLRIAADRVQPEFMDDLELDSPLARTAAPVLRGLSAALAGQAVSIVLTDQRGIVLSRLTGDAALERQLDTVRLAPGFSYAEASVGTNGIGTALEVGAPTHVFGHEHFAERLEDLACAGVPIRHPVTGRTVGVIDLTCWRRDAGALLLTLAKSTANQIQAALLKDTDLAERALFDEYLRACHRSGGIVLAIGRQLGMLNEYARTVLTPADQAALLGYAAEALSGRRAGTRDVNLPSGSTVRMRGRLVHEMDRVAGLVARVSHPFETVSESTLPAVSSGYLPGLVGRSPAWLKVCREVESVFLAGTWVALVGERAIGKESLLRAVQLRRQPVPRLTVLDAADARRSGWLRELAEALDGGADSVVLKHVDELDSTVSRNVRSALDKVREPGRPTPPWVAVTLSGTSRLDLRGLLQHFPTTIDVPPLRLHIDDVPLLTAHFLRRFSEGRVLTCSPETLRLLVRSSWPGNAKQLLEVLRWVQEHRRSGVIQPTDLPPEMATVSHRLLSQMETLERDAIVKALTLANGNKEAAADALGISRATIYRRIRTYGIVEIPN